MFVINDLNFAIFACVVTMLGWGSWANTQKLSGKECWPFPLYYCDYTFGNAVVATLFGLTLGSLGPTGMTLIESLRQADFMALRNAFLSGPLFNISNILLLVAIHAAGMSVAFPVGVGLALVIGTVMSYMRFPSGNPARLFLGVSLILMAMLFSALAHRRLQGSLSKSLARGLVFATIAGCVMGTFYPQLSSSISPAFRTGTILRGLLTPYASLLVFAAGVIASNLFANTIFAKLNGLRLNDYFSLAKALPLLRPSRESGSGRNFITRQAGRGAT